MTVKGKQFSFYADQDTERYLTSIEPGLKTKIINRALRAYMGTETAHNINIERIDSERDNSYRGV